MYCNIKKKECGDAGELVYNGFTMFGESEGLHVNTIRYKKKGHMTCNY